MGLGVAPGRVSGHRQAAGRQGGRQGKGHVQRTVPPGRRRDAEEVLGLYEAGFRTVKLRVHSFDEAEDIAQVETVRRAVGERMAIGVDANQGWRVALVDDAPLWDLPRATRFAEACAGRPDLRREVDALLAAHDADLIIDVRFLVNPYFVSELKHLDGNHAKIKKFVLSHPETRAFLQKYLDLLDYLIPLYEKEGKAYLTIAVGCTGGRHRSVTIAGAIFDHFRKTKDQGSG